MISAPSAVRIFAYALPTDMRKSFDGLHAIVTNEFTMDVLGGDYFVFFNRSLDRCKILMWDRDGLVVWAKRLERGCFQRPLDSANGLSIEIDATTLSMILGGADLKTGQGRKRYQPAAWYYANPPRGKFQIQLVRDTPANSQPPQGPRRGPAAERQGQIGRLRRIDDSSKPRHLGRDRPRGPRVHRESCTRWRRSIPQRATRGRLP